jgi:glycosyltransferase involved in cell wall biosynthesis
MTRTRMPPSVSIVIPTKDGMHTLPDVLDAIARQRFDGPIEVVAIDSGSTDGTVELLQPRVDKLLSIAPASFNHGLTRNAGIEESRGEFVVLLVQDAVPASDHWLTALIAPLIADSRVAGTFARQLPRDDASPIVRHYLERWVAGSPTGRVTELASREAFEALDPMQQFLLCVFDNVCSCVRRSVWEQYRFRTTPIGEDIEWGREVLLAGYRVTYVPESSVVHSHDRPAREEFERTRTLHRRLFELFGLRTIPTLPALARATASSLRLHWQCDRSARALSLAFAWPLGQYMGARSGARDGQASGARAV